MDRNLPTNGPLDSLFLGFWLVIKWVLNLKCKKGAIDAGDYNLGQTEVGLNKCQKSEIKKELDQNFRFMLMLVCFLA